MIELIKSTLVPQLEANSLLLQVEIGTLERNISSSYNFRLIDGIDLSVIDSLPAATKLGQGNIFTSVCQEFCPRGGRVSASVLAGIHPPPRADTTPPPGSRPPWSTHPPGSRHPLPPEQTPPDQAHISALIDGIDPPPCSLTAIAADWFCSSFTFNALLRFWNFIVVGK